MPELSNIGVIKSILERHGFSFSKGLGQNFLVNPTVCPRIAEMGGAGPGVGAIEIGTGIGVLTRELASRAEKVVAIEIDKRLMPVLDETLSDFDNIKIINDDVMNVDLAELIEREFPGLDVIVCANLPYYITSPIIMMLMESRLRLRSVTVMVQREAAQRLCAKPGTREAGAVTVAVNYFSEPELLFNVSRGSFMPQPNVDSSVIRLNIRGNTPEGVSDEKFFFKTVRAAFSQRRKTLVNSVSSGLGISKEITSAAVEAAGLPQNIRPEQLSMQRFVDLSNELKTRV